MWTVPYRCSRLLALMMFVWLAVTSVSLQASTLEQFIGEASVTDFVPAADRFGAMHESLPMVAAMKGVDVVGWVFVTSDFVSTTGYSGKPIHVMVGLNLDATITGLQLVEHSEPIVLIGIPESKITAVIDRHIGLDIVKEAQPGGSGRALDIVSGATVTIMVIDDSIVRSSLKVARLVGLGGLAPSVSNQAPARQLKQVTEPQTLSWMDMAGNGTVRALNLDVGQINELFERSGDARAIARPEKGQSTDTFISMHAALVSVPTIGTSLMGKAEYANLADKLGENEHALLLAGRGKYSFKGSGYVRGGIFDRIQLIQGDESVRFFDHQHQRLGTLAPADAPGFDEIDVFRIPAEAGFEPTEPFRIQLLIQRAVGAIDKSFLTIDLDYELPTQYTMTAASATPTQATLSPDDGSNALSHLWPRIWEQRQIDVIVLGFAIAALTAAFFFQMQLTRHERLTDAFRITFLLFTLFWLGWYANAQLSVVNVLTLFHALTSGFSWSAFLMDPLVFILWFCVAATLLFWGRGGYCGWLCPFGALQELTNRLAKLAKVPQLRLPWGLNERLWALKYMIFLGLFGLSLYSLELAERYAEVEPFKTAIILKFVREWPFVVFAVGLVFIGLFIERFYCRYLCALGAALAIPARLKLFDWLKRYRECGAPCARCANECMVQAIDPLGRIEPNECHQCMHCQVLYQSQTKCPVCIQKYKRRHRIPPSTTQPSTADAAVVTWTSKASLHPRQPGSPHRETRA